MTQIIAYINFPGNTRDAMDFYKSCLGGDLEIMTFEGSPMAGQMPPEKLQNVLHSCLSTESFKLMASDMVGPEGLNPGNNISLLIDCATEEEINRLYASLSAGGNPDHPVQPAFWGGLFGHMTDKFGIQWLLTCNPEANAK